MKILSLLLFLLSTIQVVYSQTGDADFSDREKLLQQFMESRKKMIEQMEKAFEEDDFFSGDMNDDFIEQMLGDRFNSFKSLGGSRMVSIEQVRQKDGSVDVLIKPRDKNIKLDIKTEPKAIIIQAKTINKVESHTKQGTSSQFSSGQFSQTIGIPSDMKAKDPEAFGDQIKIKLVPIVKPVNHGDRKPLLKKPGQKTI